MLNEISPSETAEELGIKFIEIIKKAQTKDGGIDMRKLAKLKEFKKLLEIAPDLILNVKRSIERLRKAKTAQALPTLQNVVTGTIQEHIAKDINATLKDNNLIKWIPSKAKTADPDHALNYGRVMTWKAAKAKKIFTRYGCKCSISILNKKIFNKADQLMKGFKI